MCQIVQKIYTHYSLVAGHKVANESLYYRQPKMVANLEANTQINRYEYSIIFHHMHIRDYIMVIASMRLSQYCMIMAVSNYSTIEK